MTHHDIIIIGAGAAGLAAAQKLRQAGHAPLVLEARQRIGGRIWTDRAHSQVELGAEFIHGDNAATWQLVEPAGLPTEPWPWRAAAGAELRRAARGGTLLPEDDPLTDRVDRLFEQVEAYNGPERSVLAEIERLTAGDSAVRPFIDHRFACMEAADISRLNAAALRQERALNSAGWENYRIRAGYDALPALLAQGVNLRLGAAVAKIRWGEDGAAITLQSGETLRAGKVIITAPLGVLQAGDIEFEPELPPAKQQAIGALAMGPVVKLVLWFGRQVWPNFTFLITDGMVLTWWMTGTPQLPALMGYIGGPAAAKLAALGEAEAVAQARREARAIFGAAVDGAFVAGRMVNWAADPWSRGAYSYTPLGASTATRAQLAAPLAYTLFFAGEATLTNGHLATVHGAIESGWRAVDEALAG
ncbi:MAG: NAD(P)/FAD-dependent oxidoreductase [Anaerolineae bacterium]